MMVGLDRWRDGLDRVQRMSDDIVSDALEDQAHEMRDDVASEWPSESGKSRRAWRVEGRRLRFAVANSAPYSGHVYRKGDARRVPIAPGLLARAEQRHHRRTLDRILDRVDRENR